MNRPPENPEPERQLSQRQLDQATTHTWRKELRYTSAMLLPAAGIAAALGNIPLAVISGTAGLAGLAIPALLNALKGKTESRK